MSYPITATEAQRRAIRDGMSLAAKRFGVICEQVKAAAGIMGRGLNQVVRANREMAEFRNSGLFRRQRESMRQMTRELVAIRKEAQREHSAYYPDAPANERTRP